MSYDSKTTRYEAIEPIESAEQVQPVSEGMDAVGFQPPEQEYRQEKRRDILMHRLAVRLLQLLKFNNKEKAKKPDVQMAKVAGAAALMQNPADRDSKQQTAMAHRPENVEAGHGSVKASKNAVGPQARLATSLTLKHELKREEKHYTSGHDLERKLEHSSPIKRAEHELGHKIEHEVGHEIGKRLVETAAHLISPQVGLIVDAVGATHPATTPEIHKPGHNDSHGGR